MKLTDDLIVSPQDAFTGAFITLFFSASRFIDAFDDYLNGQKVHLSSLVFGAILLSATIYLFLRGTQMKRKSRRQSDRDRNAAKDAV